MKGNRNWIGSSRVLMTLSITAGFIGVFVIYSQISNITKLDGLSSLFMILIGGVFVLAIHSFWGLMIGMADNIASIVDILSRTKSEAKNPNEIKISRPISKQNTPTSQSRTPPQTTGKPFIVNIEYDDKTWECGNCGQLNNPDCEFCTNCGKSKGKLKIQPPD